MNTNVRDIEDIEQIMTGGDNLCPSQFSCSPNIREQCQNCIDKYNSEDDDEDDEDQQILQHLVLLIFLVCSMFVVSCELNGGKKIVPSTFYLIFSFKGFTSLNLCLLSHF